MSLLVQSFMRRRWRRYQEGFIHNNHDGATEACSDVSSVESQEVNELDDGDFDYVAWQRHLFAMQEEEPDIASTEGWQEECDTVEEPVADTSLKKPPPTTSSDHHRGDSVVDVEKSLALMVVSEIEESETQKNITALESETKINASLQRPESPRQLLLHSSHDHVSRQPPSKASVYSNASTSRKHNTNIASSRGAPPKQHLTTSRFFVDEHTMDKNKLETASTRIPTPLCASPPPTALHLLGDEESLTEYECLIRKQVEFFFQPTTEAVMVGIRCRHCSHVTKPPPCSFQLPIHESLANVAHGLVTHHIQSCPFVSKAMRQELIRCQPAEETPTFHHKYWREASKECGMDSSTPTLTLSPARWRDEAVERRKLPLRYYNYRVGGTAQRRFNRYHPAR